MQEPRPIPGPTLLEDETPAGARASENNASLKRSSEVAVGASVPQSRVPMLASATAPAEGPRPAPGLPVPEREARSQEKGTEPQRVVLAIGLPGAGKTGWFRKHSIKPLSSDELRILLADDVEEQGFQEDIFRALRFLLNLRLRMGRPVTYIDATNLVASHRRDFIDIAKQYGCQMEALFFDVPLEICLQRHGVRGRRVPRDVMEAMAGRLEPPSLEEGFCRITTIGPNGEQISEVCAEASHREGRRRTRERSR